MKYRSCIADLPRRKHTSDAKVCFGVSCFLNLWIRFVKNMIRRTRATAKNIFDCRSLSFLSLSFMGCVFFIFLSQWVYTSFNTVSNLPMKSSTFSLVNTNGGRIRRMLVPAQPVKQCCSWMSLLRTSL